jgi:hypothetical protein
MDFVGGALPNVMFLIGVMAVGIGLGLEFKIVEMKGDLGRASRLGALGVGVALIATSIYLYLTPRPIPMPTAAPTPIAVQVPTPTNPATAVLPSATAEMPTPMPTNPPTVTMPPTSTPEPATPTAEPTASAALVTVPDIRNLNTKDADKLLRGLKLSRGERFERCSDLGVTEMKVGKDRIACQSPEPGEQVASGSRIDYVIASKAND